MLHTENAQWPLAEILRKTVLRLVEITTTTFTPRLPVTEEAVLTRITGAHEDYLRSKCACDNGHSFTAVQCYFRPCWTYGLCSEWGRSTLERENFCRESPHHAQNVLIALSGWGLSGGQIAADYQNDAFSSGVFSPVWGPGCKCGDPGCLLLPPRAQLLFLPCVGQVLGAPQLLDAQ